MKRNFILVFLLFVNFLVAQEEQAILYFNDGTDLKGFGMIKSGTLGDKDVIKFRISSDSEADVWDSSMVSSIVFIANDEREEFRYVEISKNALYPRLLKIFSEGKVMLYGDIERKGLLNFNRNAQQQNSSNGGDFLVSNPKRNKSSIYQNEDRKNVVFYVKREKELYPTKLAGSLVNWKKIAKQYFNDCEVIGERIDDKTYKINNLVEIVDVYNDDCLD